MIGIFDFSKSDQVIFALADDHPLIEMFRKQGFDIRPVKTCPVCHGCGHIIDAQKINEEREEK